MRTFTTTELERMQGTQVSAMMDICTLLVYSQVQSGSGHPTKTWTDGRLLQCGLDMTGDEEAHKQNMTVVRYDAMLRLPLNTSFSMKDRIRLEFQFGQPTDTNTVYEFAGPAQQGPSGLVVPLRKVNPRVENE